MSLPRVENTSWPSRFVRTPLDPRWRGWVLFGTLLVAYTYSFQIGGGWNFASRYDLLHCLVRAHTLEITALHENTGDKALWKGRYYSDKAPGATLLGLPGYLLAQGLVRLLRLDVSWLILLPNNLSPMTAVSLPSALLGLVLYHFAGRLELSPRRRVLVVVGYGLGTLAWPYSTLFFSHQTVAALGFGAFAVAVGVVRDGRRLWWAALAGLLCGYAVASEYPAVITMAAVGLYLLIGTRSLRAAAAFVGGVALPLAGLLLYNQVCFDSPLRFGYMLEARQEFAGGPVAWLSHPRLEALWGILFSRDKGLFALCPVLIVAALGWAIMARDRSWRRELCVCLSVCVAFVLMNASHEFWRGGGCLGPRHVVPMLPFLWVGFIWAARACTGVWRWPLLILTLVSAAAMFTVTFTAPAPRIGITNPIYGYALPLLLAGDFTLAPNWGLLVLPGHWCLAPVLAALALGLSLALKGTGGKGRTDSGLRTDPRTREEATCGPA